MPGVNDVTGQDVTGQTDSPRRRVPSSPGTRLEPPDYGRGVAAAKQGNHKEAAAAFRSSVQANPNHAPSHANLGAAYAQLKEYRSAIEALEIAVELVPTDANSLTNLARCWHLIGNPGLAAERAEQALILNPANASALWTITVSCLAIGNGRKALKGAVDLAKIAPSRESHVLLIRSLLAAGLFEKAEVEAERYVAKMKEAVAQSDQVTEDAIRHIAQAELLRVQAIRAGNHSTKAVGPKLPLVRRRREEVLELLLQIVKDAPTGDACYELGRAHHDLHQHAESETALRKSIELQPDNAAALELLGDVLIERSRNEEAVEMLDRALAINPHQSKALLMRVKTKADEAERRAFHAKLDEYLAMPDVRPNDRINWNFAKGQLFDKSKEYDKAFAHYLEAGRLKEKGQNRQEAIPTPDGNAPDSSAKLRAEHDDRHRRHYEASERAFTPEFFESRAEAGNLSRRPIFVVGVPRSGTTLLEQILASHPSVAGAGELPEISSFAARCDTLTESQGGYPGAITSVPMEMLASFGNEYLAQLDRVSSTAERVVDKMPGNLIHIGLIHTLFPNASIVRIRRDPRDVCVSALKNHLDYPLCNLEKTAKFCVACDQLTELWNDILPGRVLQLDYEELVTDLEANVRKLLEHCELEWDDNCLTFYRTERHVRTPSRWQVRKPAYSSSIGAWKRYANSLTHLDAILGPAPD